MTLRAIHRWLTVLFAIFMLWIAGTGVASQIVPLVQTKPAAQREAPQAQTAVAPPVNVSANSAADAAAASGPDEAAPAAAAPAPRRRSLVGLLHHLHSGESFGPLGVAISTLSGLALMFFAVSGMWMYFQMWRTRKSRSGKSGLFW
ncbi:MAG: PepSY domain-containing protein [Hyphomonadaceae bacterium]